MAITEFQRDICRLISRQRLESGESYVAGGVALNTLTGAARLSRDIALFHDTADAVGASWEADRKVLELAGFSKLIQLPCSGAKASDRNRGRYVPGRLRKIRFDQESIRSTKSH